MTGRGPRRVAAAREAFLSGEAPDGVRSDIVASWRRSEVSGVNPDRLVLPFSADFDPKLSRLYLAAEPILRRFAERLHDTQSSIVLADRQARVLGRWSGDRALDNGLEHLSVACGFSVAEHVAGTNGLGTALEEGRPAAIQGSEHFAEPFMNFTCIASPIRHPLTRHIEGGINIACRYRDTNSLVLPMVLEMASEVEEALYSQGSRRERALFDTFLVASRESTLPVVCMSEQLMMSNAVAARLLDGTDQVVLWEQAHHAVAQDHETTIVVTLADGRTIQALCKPVDASGRNVGVVIELDASALADVRSKRRQAAEDDTTSPLVGESRAWRDVESLTRRVANSGLPILFVGEPGVGKTTLARFAHGVSGVGGDFIVHDAALAHLDGTDTWLRHLRHILSNRTGTVLLRRLALLDGATAGAVCGLIDEMADDSPRLMASAITDLPTDPGAQPLFDRLAVTRIAVPPLRNRPEDVRALANHFIRAHSAEQPAPRLTPEVVQAFLRLDWPGNVRQLDNVVRGLVSSGRRSDVQLGDLPEDLRAQTARHSLTRLEQLELDQILVALRLAQGNKLEAAKALGISRSTLYRKLAASGIELDRSIF